MSVISQSETDRFVVKNSFFMQGQDWTSCEKHPDVLSKFPHLKNNHLVQIFSAQNVVENDGNISQYKIHQDLRMMQFQR